MKRILFVDEVAVLDGLRDRLRKHRREWDMPRAARRGPIRAGDSAPLAYIVCKLNVKPNVVFPARRRPPCAVRYAVFFGAVALLGCGSVAELLGVIVGDSGAGQANREDAQGSDVQSEATAEAPSTDAAVPGVDAADTAADAAPSCDPSKAFGPPALLSSLQSTDKQGGLRLLPNELSGFFWNARDGGPGYINLYELSRPEMDAAFGGVKRLNNVNLPASLNMDPTTTANGATLIYRYRMGRYDSGLDQLYMAERADAASDFSVGTPVPGLSAGATNNVQPYILPDGTELYFSSNRGVDFGIYRSLRVGGAFGAPSPVSELNLSGANEGDPLVTADDLTIYLSSTRPGGMGMQDIWMAQRPDKSSAFAGLVNLKEVNSTGVDAPTWISPDGCRLYLSSDRADAGFDLYMASRLQ